QSVAVYVISEYSKPVRRIDRLHSSKISKLARRYGSSESIPQGEWDTLNDERIAACITKWRGFEDGGQPLPYSSANAIAIVEGLRLHRPTRLKQIVATFASHGSFFAKPSVA